MDADNSLMTRQQLAAELSVDPNTAEKLAELGRIPKPIDLGTDGKKMLRWRRADFDKWLSDGCPSVDQS